MPGVSEDGLSRRLSASVTLFVSLSLMLIASLIFTLLESARVHGLKAYSAMTAYSAVESLFSRYSDWIYKNYDIFLLDASFGEGAISVSGLNGILTEYSTKTLDPTDRTWFADGVNFYQMRVENAAVSSFLLATDFEGEAFVRAVCDQNRYLVGVESAQEIYGDLSGQRDTVEETGDMESIMDEATGEVDTMIQEAREEAEEAAFEAGEYGDELYDGGALGDGDEDEGVPESPVDTVKDIMTMDLLNLVIPKGQAISAKHVDQNDDFFSDLFGERERFGSLVAMEDRVLNTGNMEDVYEDDILNVVWFNQYMKDRLRCYLDSGSEEDFSHALDYEIEYIMAGKNSDRDNLAAVVNELLLVREAANFLYLNSDPVKSEEAFTLAVAILAPTGVGESACTLLQQAILAAWAFIESVLDIRALLAGRKIDWMKNEATWTCDLDGIAEVTGGGLMSIDSDTGEDYRAYLEKLIYLNDLKQCGRRLMQIIEFNYRLVEGHEDFCMDNCILAAEADLEYKSDQLFLSFVTLLYGDREYGSFKEHVEYKY